MLSQIKLAAKRTKKTMRRRENRGLVNRYGNVIVKMKVKENNKEESLLFPLYELYKGWIKARVAKRQENQRIASILRKEKLNANSK